MGILLVLGGLYAPTGVIPGLIAFGLFFITAAAITLFVNLRPRG